MLLSSSPLKASHLALVLGLIVVPGQGCSTSAEPAGAISPPAKAEHVGTATAAFTPTMLYSCTDITQPGLYELPQDLAAPPGQPCIQVHSQGPVTIDCQLASITSAAPGQEPILVQNSDNFTIQNCFIGPSDADQDSVEVQIEQSSNGTLQNNYFYNSPIPSEYNPILVLSSDSITVTGNTFYVTYSQSNTTNSRIENNSFSCFSTVCPEMIQSAGGWNNIVANNTMDGRTSADQLPTSTGTDDGIIIATEVGDAVFGNTISNVFDCGIETAGAVVASSFNDNTITNAANCGIGGWYGMSFYYNIVHGNTVNGSAALFTFFRYRGLSATETGVYFTDNTFDGNSITNLYPTARYGPASGYSVYMPFEIQGGEYMGYTGTATAGQTDPTPSQFFLTGNSFSNNNFGSEVAYFGEPAYPGAVSDQGGNVCVLANRTDYPLACGR